MSEQIKIAFESWYDNDIDEPLPTDYTIMGKRYLYMGWKAATTETNKRINELEGEVAELKAKSSDYAVKAINIHNQDSSIIRTLRNVLNSFDIHDSTGLQPLWVTTMSAEQIDKALSATPAESLQAHDAETIKRYADDLYNNHWVFIPHDLRKPLKEVK